MAGDGFADVQRTRIKNDPKLAEEPKGRSTSGWRRNGPPLPALCPNCKTVFPSRNYDFGTPRFYSRDNEETCRTCGFEHAKVSDGLFDLATEAIKVLQAPEITWSMIAEIARIADSAVADEITPEQAIARFTDINPRLGEISRRAAKFGSSGINYISAALALAALVYAHVGTMAALESRDLAREQTAYAHEQTAIARESLRIQKEAASSDEMTKTIMEELSSLKFEIKSRPTDRVSRANPDQPRTSVRENTITRGSRRSGQHPNFTHHHKSYRPSCK